MSWITTYTGRKIELLSPNPEDISIQDIAKGLSNVCRFAGQIQDFYSVAEHSIHVARLLQDHSATWDTVVAGLLHDAAEAYIGDITSPLKQHLPDYRFIEQRVEGSIQRHFQEVINWHNVDRMQIKRADLAMLNIEAVEFYGEEHVRMWSERIPKERLPVMELPITKSPPTIACDDFLRAFRLLLTRERC